MSNEQQLKPIEEIQARINNLQYQKDILLRDYAEAKTEDEKNFLAGEIVSLDLRMNDLKWVIGQK